MTQPPHCLSTAAGPSDAYAATCGIRVKQFAVMACTDLE
jgi:hypothetical protein